MRVLILGGNGMLGHQLLKHLKSNHEVRVTLRQELSVYEKFDLFNKQNAYGAVDVRNLKHLTEVLNDYQPQVVINAVGIVKQRADAHKIIPNLEINALFPHQLARLCNDIKSRVLHMSTDCVFSGKKGNYSESDFSDADDLYGRTKLLGEISAKHCLTLRTSIIGRELAGKKNLLEWFLSQKNSVKGYKAVIFSGFTTLELSRIIENIIVKHSRISGIYHVSSEPISKFEVLSRIRKKLDLSLEVLPDDEIKCDRSLDSTKFRMEFNYKPPTWDEMINELCEEIRIGKIQTDEAKQR